MTSSNRMCQSGGREKREDAKGPATMGGQVDKRAAGSGHSQPEGQNSTTIYSYYYYYFYGVRVLLLLLRTVVRSALTTTCWLAWRGCAAGRVFDFGPSPISSHPTATILPNPSHDSRGNGRERNTSTGTTAKSAPAPAPAPLTRCILQSFSLTWM
jgi:hypothetical protein